MSTIYRYVLLLQILVIICNVLTVFCQESAILENEKDAFNVIHNYLNESLTARIPREICDHFDCCTMSNTESCSMDKLAESRRSTIVMPGGKTRCILDSSTPYGFQVVPGDKDKIVVFFGGGGACWDQFSTDVGFCFDGDAWAGNTTQSYTSRGSSVVQVGLENAQATLDWIVQQQQLGLLSETFNDLIITGSSAGSIGVQLWSTQVLTQLKWKSAAIIPDSYIGVFPRGTEGPLMYHFGLCNWNNLPSQLHASCVNQRITLQTANNYYFTQFPTVPRAFLQSKEDIVQRSYYIAVAWTMNSTVPFLTPAIFYDEVNSILGGYSKKFPNVLSYVVNHDRHEYIYWEVYKTADAVGPRDNNSDKNTNELLYQWVNHFPIPVGNSVSSVCDGAIDTQDGKLDNSYCSSSVVPKTFVQV